MTIAAILIALALAFLAFRFLKGLFKFALLAVVIILARWFVVGGTPGMGVH
jgi:hypothetical protein